MTTTLVLGGARSGKSAYAEKLAVQSRREVLYLATASAGDAEMGARIAQHRSERPQHWSTVEEPLHLASALQRHGTEDNLILVDCLTLWLSNLLFYGGAGPDVGVITLPPLFIEQRAALLDALHKAPGDVVLVSNEVGMGIVPMGAMTRCFADEAGRLNQAVAAVCERVVFVAAGLPLTLKA
ncbi:bifunctional adenosylcobinamide kinase/adenosylcobinamide-phosphate guanylyltransferase [Massilia sp. TWP1-3-3]|uniref:bifunctional adenosylcobinamide kinase/adenosylcobinamide-phosphate guanylyltransferase n=1 Tax=Massilia sp. TWP1-3-3 TaxID=2804573 RepID=UPI003CE87D3A